MTDSEEGVTPEGRGAGALDSSPAQVYPISALQQDPKNLGAASER